MDDTVIRAHTGTPQELGASPANGTKKGAPEPPKTRPWESAEEVFRPSCTSPATARAGRSRCHSPRANATAAPSLRGPSTRCELHARKALPAGRANAPPTCSPTGATASRAAQSCSAQARHLSHHPLAQGPEGASPGASGTPARFRNREAYRRRRNVVERCVNRLKRWRAIATRYEKRAVDYRAMVVIASLMMWLPS